MGDLKLHEGNVIKLKYNDYNDYVIVDHRDEDDYKIWCRWLTRNSSIAMNKVELVWVTDAEVAGAATNPEMELLNDKDAFEIILKSKL